MSKVSTHLLHFWECFSQAEWCLMAWACPGQALGEQHASEESIKESLRKARLAFVRVEGLDRNTPTGTRRATSILALWIINARRGSGAATVAFREKMIRLARARRQDCLLYHLAGARQVQLMETGNATTLERYSEADAGLSAYFSRISGGTFELAVFERWINPSRSPGWMLRMGADAQGEMIAAANFLPLRLDRSVESLLSELRSRELEFGFYSRHSRQRAARASHLKTGCEEAELQVFEDGDVGHEVGPSFTLVRAAKGAELRDRLMDCAVAYRQDDVVFVHADGAIELVEPYHEKVREAFVSMPAALRAYAGRLAHGILFPRGYLKFAQDRSAG